MADNIEPWAAIVSAETEHPAKAIKGSGSANVIIANQQAWRGSTDEHACEADGPEVVVAPSDKVFINGQGATRKGHFLLPKNGGPPDRINGGAAKVWIGDTGIGAMQKKNLEEMVKALCELKADWAGLTPDQRLDRLQQIVNDQSARTGMKAPKLRRLLPTDYDGKGVGYSGTWEGWTWEMPINAGMLDKPTWPGKYVGGVVGHEVRHSEQTWYSVRKRATDLCALNGGCQTSEQREQVVQMVADSTGVKRDAAVAAVQQPLSKDSAEYRYATVHEQQSTSGFGWTDVNEAMRKSRKANQKTKAQRQQVTDYDAKHAYHLRPGGSDANEVGYSIENMMAECCP